MKLYILYRGRSKSNLKPIMIDRIEKVDNYYKTLIKSDPGSGKTWHYDIQMAPSDAEVWRKNNNSNQWTNYNSSNPPKVKNGSRF